MTVNVYNGMLILLEFLFVILKVFYYICYKAGCATFTSTKKKNVAGEIVLITGAGHGIGKELAIGYASLGATVVCWDINKETNEQTMNEIKNMGKTAVYAYQCDVANREQVLNVAEKVKKEVGNVTILINNAGIAYLQKFLNYSVNEIKEVFDVNIMGHYWTLKAFLPDMIEKNHGHVVALASIAALVCYTHGTVYCPTKFAVRALMESLNEELRTSSKGKSSIKFTTIYPALVGTGLVKKFKTRFPSIIRELSPQKTASLIIDAQRRNFRQQSIPSIYLSLESLIRFLPDEAIQCIIDFFDTSFGEDD